MNFTVFFFVLSFFCIVYFLLCVFRKKINLKNFFVLGLIFGWLILSKTNLNLLRGNIDPVFHLSYLNSLNGFPVFFWVQYLLDLITGNAYFWLPLIFGALSFFVLLVWLNEKKINLVVLFLCCFIFSPILLFLFSFSRESILVFFSLCFFFFLEKYFYLNDLKALHLSLIFLAFSVLTKLNSIFLVVFCFFVLLQRKAKLKFFGVLVLMVVYLLVFTNFGAFFVLSFRSDATNNTLNSLWLILFAFPIAFFALFKPFVKPKKFLWQLTFFSLIVLVLMELKFNFLLNFNLNTMDQTVRRYGLVFFFPITIWLSNEIQLFYDKLKEKKVK